MARPPANGKADTSAGSITLAPLTALPVLAPGQSVLASVLSEQQAAVLDSWVRAQLTSSAFHAGRVSETEVRAESANILRALGTATAAGNVSDVRTAGFAELTRLLGTMSKDRAGQGYSPSETAVAVFSLKEALSAALDVACADRPAELAAETRTMGALIDALVVLVFEAYVQGREDIIASQQRSMMELSTPVVKLWDGIVAVPLIGTLDSVRTQTVMENLLQAIVDTGSRVAIIDITGVAVVDTLVAQHLLKTVAATRLMGADCIISGIRPQIAQTIVHLGLELGDVVTKATLADAFRVALSQVGATMPAGLPAQPTDRR